MVWTWAELVVWLVHVYARDRALLWLIDALGFDVSRPGQLRTDLREYFSMPFRATTCLVWAGPG